MFKSIFKEFKTAEKPCEFFVELKLFRCGLDEYSNGFSHVNMETKEELVLSQLDKSNWNWRNAFYLLRRCPIGTGEEKWRPIVEEIRSTFDRGLGRIDVDFLEIGYFFK